MQLFSERVRGLVCVIVVFAVCGAAGAPGLAAELSRYGAPDTPPFNERFPSGTIDSVEHADAALAQSNLEREIIDDQYLDAQRGCYQKFFVSHCLEVAKERNRVAVKQVKEVEVEANAFKRKAKADDRDQVLADQRQKDEQDAIERAADQKAHEAAAARKLSDSVAKEQQVKEREQQTAGQEDLRVRQHAEKQRQESAAEATKAPQRAANEQAYKQKVQKAEAHRKEVEERQAQKARERAAKSQSAPPETPAPSAPK